MRASTATLPSVTSLWANWKKNGTAQAVASEASAKAEATPSPWRLLFVIWAKGLAIWSVVFFMAMVWHWTA